MKADLEKSHFWEEAGDTPYYWAGWEISPLEGTINHGGNNPDFSSQVFISLAEKKAVFVLCNMNGAAAEVIGTDIMALMNGESVSHSLALDAPLFLFHALGLVYSAANGRPGAGSCDDCNVFSFCCASK